MTVTPQRQTGAVLITALIFLVILTLISVAAMRASTLGLRMAGNEQEQRRALQSTQSAVVGTLAQAPLQVAAVGTTNCYRFDSSTSIPGDCNVTTTLNPGTGYDAHNLVKVKLNVLGICPRNVGNSETGTFSLYTDGSTGAGSCGYFTIDSSYNAIAERGGAAAITVGYIQAL